MSDDFQQQIQNPRIQRLLEIAKQYPNVYMPWSEEDDRTLMDAEKMFHALSPKRKNIRGTFIQAMADKLGRHPKAIQSRIKKLSDEQANGQSGEGI